MLSSQQRARKDAAASANTSSGLQASTGSDDVQASAGAVDVQRFDRLKITELKRVRADNQLLVASGAEEETTQTSEKAQIRGLGAIPNQAVWGAAR